MHSQRSWWRLALAVEAPVEWLTRCVRPPRRTEPASLRKQRSPLSPTPRCTRASRGRGSSSTGRVGFARRSDVVAWASDTRECPLADTPASLRGSEVIRVREEAQPVGSSEELVARPRVSDHLPVRVERIPVHGCEDGVLADFASVDLDRPPRPSACRKAIGVDGRKEVIPNGVAIRQVDRLSPPDREKRPNAEIGHTLYI